MTKRKKQPQAEVKFIIYLRLMKDATVYLLEVGCPFLSCFLFICVPLLLSAQILCLLYAVNKAPKGMTSVIYPTRVYCSLVRIITTCYQ